MNNIYLFLFWFGILHNLSNMVVKWFNLPQFIRINYIFAEILKLEIKSIKFINRAEPMSD